MIKISIHQDITILRAPNKRSSQYMKQKLIELRGAIQKSPHVLGEFYTHPSVINTTHRQKKKISKDTEDLSNTMNSTNMMNISRTCYTTQNTHFFFKYPWNIRYILGIEQSLTFEIMQHILSDHNGIYSDNNNKIIWKIPQIFGN